MDPARADDTPKSSLDLTKLTDEELDLFERLLAKAQRPSTNGDD